MRTPSNRHGERNDASWRANRRADRIHGTRVALALFVSILATSWVSAQEAFGGRIGEPSYIVVATDVSASMNVNDPLVRDADGKTRAIRDDAQISFLQLLPFLRRPNFVGAARFTDDVTPVPLSGDGEGLVSWDSTRIDWDRLRPTIQTVETKRGKTRLDKAMEWALEAIEDAREKSGWGRGALILLSDGDPDAFRGRRGDGGRGALAKAQELRQKGIRVYPIIINKASFRPGRRAEALSPADRQAEALMERIAGATQGKAYTITPARSLLDIFLDVLGDRGQPADEFLVSKYHRSVVVIGSPVESIEVSSPGGKTHSLSIANGNDAQTGIDQRVVPLTTWDIVILRRPLDLARVDEHWSGRWKLDPKRTPYRGRVYLIPDFLLELGGVERDSLWVEEDVAVNAKIVERPTELVEEGRAVPPLETDDLLVTLTFSGTEGGHAEELHSGKFEGTTFTSNPFSIDTPGRYRISAECFDTLGDEKIPLGTFTRDVEVKPCPVRVRIRDQAKNASILELPARSEAGDANASCKGGDEIVVEVLPEKGLPDGDANRIAATFRSSNVGPGEWKLARNGNSLSTPAIALPIDEQHLAGEVEVAIGDRTLRFDDILLPFGAAPLRVEHRFGGGRTTLWAGEYPRETVTVVAMPVFDESAEKVASSFPEVLPDIAVTARGEDAATRLAVGVRRVGPPQRKDAALEATYEVFVKEPIPHGATELVIDPGSTLPGMRGKPVRYDVVSPADTGLFQWRVAPLRDAKANAELAQGVAERLYNEEPAQFSASWEADLGVESIAFEVRPATRGRDGDETKESAEALARVELSSDGTSASKSEILDNLEPERSYRMDVVLRMKGDGETAREIRVSGSEFRYEPRRLELVTFEIGASDRLLSSRAHERIVLPVRATFSGWDRAKHFQALREFEASCAILLDDGVARDGGSSPIAMRFTDRQEDGDGGYLLVGEAELCPDRPGLLWVEVNGELAADDGLKRTLRAATQIEVGDPALSVRVVERDGEQVLFDSRQKSDGHLANPRQWPFAQRLAVEIARLDAADATAWPLRVVLTRQSPNGGDVKTTVEECVLDPSGRTTVSFRPVEEGRYRIHVEPNGQEAPPIYLGTPELIERRVPELVTALAPPPTITPRTREWPFEYRVEITEGWPGRPEAMSFEFQLPGIEDWIPGRLGVSQDGSQLILRSPEFLPPMRDVQSGSVTLALRLHSDHRRSGSGAARAKARDDDAGEVYENVWTIEGQVVRLDPKLSGISIHAGGDEIDPAEVISAGEALKVAASIGPRPERWELE
ncbi:MAG TPA: hypothetical protein VK116_00885, partial [Planctomycetota bacterium]|nr:hypothetical protein [Planctomycetota bacterium]